MDEAVKARLDAIQASLLRIEAAQLVQGKTLGDHAERIKGCESQIANRSALGVVGLAASFVWDVMVAGRR